ncbi:CRISPR-associated endonuclease Cas1 [Candidatus Viridilinea mediisalina]|uniref:CRISPR-associated endonuclease Cas1 n=1 Tax=Candidatus Viridilinea mediisalina TaxID=2024553 RepID=A0A2A6RNI7_9CHLR|nr:CRISPR-associated endonuclease Cas1 [Candidatus Viridilinea mediisalina]PDW04664.1 CRISPR-associated endonuclease Cas1 [Candidatus Viridilinea mediisalina]
MHLFVQEKGAFIAKHQGRLRVNKEKTRLQEVPLLHLQQVIVNGGGVGISSDAIRACSEEGIPIHFISSNGTPHSSLYSAGLTGTVLTRRAQLRAYDGPPGVALAQGFTLGKLQNQANLLRYIAKYRKEAAPELYDSFMLVASEVVDSLQAIRNLRGGCVDELREQLMGIEGRYAARYWGALAALVPSELAWPGRETRGASDPFNQVLNYGYGVLYGQVEHALVLAGLDPYAGLLHADRPGKPSLVLDLIEEFRQAVVDRTLLGQINRGWSIERDERGWLVAATRERIVEKVLERLESAEAYEGKRQPLRHILQCQARHIATFVRGEREEYTPFVMGW